jgi:hypothetical protein
MDLMKKTELLRIPILDSGLVGYAIISLSDTW